MGLLLFSFLRFHFPWLTDIVLEQHFSEFSEAYVVPGDLMTKGGDFLAEAERLKEASHGQAVTLAMLQGTLLLFERFAPFLILLGLGVFFFFFFLLAIDICTFFHPYTY